jgi:hypothetical protein
MAETTVHVTVYGCPVPARATVLQTLRHYDLELPDAVSRDRLQLGAGYVNETGDSSWPGELLTLLTRHSTGIRFAAWSEIAAGELGTWTAYTPPLGSFEGGCDSHGDALINWYPGIAAGITDVVTLTAKIGRIAGQPWRDDLTAWLAAHPQDDPFTHRPGESPAAGVCPA